jgi:hypothetical protein
MPIGLLIGWLIGQLLFGIVTISSNQPLGRQTELATIERQKLHAIGVFLFATAFFGLIGTIIELLVR